MKRISRKVLLQRNLSIRVKKLSINNITCKRPGTGILAKNYFKVIGRKTKKKILKDQMILSKDLFL